MTVIPDDISPEVEEFTGATKEAIDKYVASGRPMDEALMLIRAMVRILELKNNGGR